MSTERIAVGGGDRRLTLIAGVGVAVALAAVIARTAGVLPSSAAAGIALVGVVIGLRVALVFAGRSASTPSRARIMTIVSTVGLAISAVTLVATLPRATQPAGFGLFVTDLLTYAWPLVLLTAVAGPARTLGWRAFAGAGLMGFLAISSLARVVGTPVVHRLGTSSLLATAVWVPFTEEVLKGLPVLLIVALAARRTRVRPAALDMMLLGAWTAAGFALYENALYGRGGATWSADAPFSVLFPTEYQAQNLGSSVVVGGHLVYTALLGLGLGFGLLYRRRFRWAWLAAPVTFAVVVAEHMAADALALASPDGSVPLLERILAPLTLGGRLSSLLLVAGLVGVAVIEWRAVHGPRRFAQFALVPSAEGNRRSQWLALAQRPSTPAPMPSTVAPETTRSLR